MILDPRAGSGVLRPFIPAGIPVAESYLDAGDAYFNGFGPGGRLRRVGIEVKHLSDFLGSMESGRLQKQVRGEQNVVGMRDEYDVVLLLLQDRIAADQYGNVLVWLPKDKDSRGRELGLRRYNEPHYSRGRYARAYFGRKTPILWTTLQKRLSTLRYKAGVGVLHAGSNQEAGLVLAAEYAWWRDAGGWESHKSMNTFYEGPLPPATLGKPTTTMKVIKQLVYGIDWERATNAADYFRTVRAAVNASAAEWAVAVQPGTVQKVIAQRALKAIDEEHHYRTASGRRDDGRRRGGKQ